MKNANASIKPVVIRKMEHVPVHLDTSVICAKIIAKRIFLEIIAYRFATVMIIILIIAILLLDGVTVNHNGEEYVAKRNVRLVCTVMIATKNVTARITVLATRTADCACVHGVGRESIAHNLAKRVGMVCGARKNVPI